MANPRKITAIVIHCSASKDGIAKSREDLVREHQTRGFRTIGYHWVVEPDGALVAGRPESAIGAHVEGHNADTIGVCMIGTKRFTSKAWATLATVAKNLQRTYPGARLLGHRDFSPDLDHDGKIEPHEWIKLCPNFDVATWVADGFTPKPENVL